MTFTATITGQSPGGTVNFKDGATTITGCGAVAVVSGAAQCATAALAVGSHSITAVYGGDGNNTGNTSMVFTQVVNKVVTATGLATSGTPSTFGQSVTFTATVTGQSPSGSVNFKDGGNTIAGCGAVSLAGGQAQCASAALATGSHVITAIYGGDGNNAGSTSSMLGQTVDPAPTSTGLTASVNPSTFGQGVTFTATVTGQAPGGTVTFRDGAATIAGCSGVSLAGGQAQCATGALGVGPHGITATYNGDTNNAGSVSVTLGQTVDRAPTTTSLGSSLNPSRFGGSVTITATVSGPSPSGAVNFKDAGASIVGCAAVAVAGGQAQCTTGAFAVGMHGITAEYGGDSNHVASTSPVLNQVVNQALTTTALGSSANPSAFAQSVTFTATVTGQSPSGSVTFRDGAATLAGCGAVMLAGGQAQCPGGLLGAAVHGISATYNGDVNNAGSVSATLSQTVNAASTSTSLMSTANPSRFGAGVTFTATVTGASPAGTVDFRDGASGIAGCSAVTLSAGSAQCATAALPVGTRAITASYNGDANHAASTSSPLNQVVDKALTATTLGVSPNPSVTGQSVTFTATVGGQSPAGTVDFREGGSSIAGCDAIPVVAGQAQCATAALGVGTHNVTATYGGDGNNTGGTSNAVDQVVVSGVQVAMLVLSANGPVHRGQAGTVSAVVTGSSPTGTVDVTGAGAQCTIMLAGGAGDCQLTPAIVGAGQTLTGHYNGDAANTEASATTQLTVKPTLDVDDNGSADALTDGLLTIRYLFGLSGTALTNGAIGTGASLTTPAAIHDYLQQVAPTLDIDGNGSTDALTDGLLVIRYLFGLRGQALIQGAIGPGATRTTAAQIEAWISSLIQ